MAKSKFEYVKSFEINDKCLPNTWIVVRIDGKGFHKFADSHGFIKPNDERALNLMNAAAVATMNEYQPHIVCSYGESDEYSFVIKKSSTLYSRRSSKLMSTIVSFFTSSYVFRWAEFFPDTPLQYPPSFDGRVVLYPSDENLLDYLSWRQADCHINNLYNTCFWSLVQIGGLTTKEAEKQLSGTVSSEKNELLFTRFKINYNSLPPMYRKGTFLMWEAYKEEVVRAHLGGTSKAHVTENPVATSVASTDSLSQQSQTNPAVSSSPSSSVNTTISYRTRKRVVIVHTSIIEKEFWTKHSNILN